MGQKNKKKFLFLLASIKKVFSFFFSYGKRAKKTKIFYLFSFLPIAMALVIKFVQFFSGRTNIPSMYIFSNMIMAFYLQFLILILALFFGTSVCSEEIEGKTLTYLTTRPISKSSIILGKYAAYTLLILLMTVLGVIFSFFVLNVDGLLNLAAYKTLLRDIAVLSIGLVCYTSFFTFIGTFMKRSIMFGLIFSFGWENVIQYFPGSTQRFTIVHYLKSLLPSTTEGGRFSFLLFRLEPIYPGVAVLMLFLITGAFLVLACLFFSLKEYILED
ncbi:ABC transporter permease [Acidobacteriota bacterium]